MSDLTELQHLFHLRIQKNQGNNNYVLKINLTIITHSNLSNHSSHNLYSGNNLSVVFYPVDPRAVWDPVTIVKKEWNFSNCSSLFLYV